MLTVFCRSLSVLEKQSAAQATHFYSQNSANNPELWVTLSELLQIPFILAIQPHQVELWYWGRASVQKYTPSQLWRVPQWSRVEVYETDVGHSTPSEVSSGVWCGQQELRPTFYGPNSEAIAYRLRDWWGNLELSPQRGSASQGPVEDFGKPATRIMPSRNTCSNNPGSVMVVYTKAYGLK